MVDSSTTFDEVKTESLSKSRRSDIEGLLKLAEELQGKYDRTSQRLEFYRFMQVMLIVVSVALIFVSRSKSSTSERATISRSARCLIRRIKNSIVTI